FHPLLCEICSFKASSAETRQPKSGETVKQLGAPPSQKCKRVRGHSKMDASSIAASLDSSLVDGSSVRRSRIDRSAANESTMLRNVHSTAGCCSRLKSEDVVGRKSKANTHPKRIDGKARVELQSGPTQPLDGGNRNDVTSHRQSDECLSTKEEFSADGELRKRSHFAEARERFLRQVQQAALAENTAKSTAEQVDSLSCTTEKRYEDGTRATASVNRSNGSFVGKTFCNKSVNEAPHAAATALRDPRRAPRRLSIEWQPASTGGGVGSTLTNSERSLTKNEKNVSSEERKENGAQAITSGTEDRAMSRREHSMASHEELLSVQLMSGSNVPSFRQLRTSQMDSSQYLISPHDLNIWNSVAPLNAMANPSYHPWDITLELAAHARRIPERACGCCRNHEEVVDARAGLPCSLKRCECAKETRQTGVSGEEGVELLHESMSEAVLMGRLVQASTSTSAAVDSVSEVERSEPVIGHAEDRVELGSVDLAVEPISPVQSRSAEEATHAADSASIIPSKLMSEKSRSFMIRSILAEVDAVAKAIMSSWSSRALSATVILFGYLLYSSKTIIEPV
uniref:Ovule protein n=1 Tax=Parascaris univalens TaxID=6257 RepID=A0A915AA02_PARUN